MPRDDEEHAKIYGRINTLESKVDETNGYLRGVVETNERLIKLLSRAQYMLGFIICVLLFALVYGAIGDKGLHAVRETLPTVPKMAAIPPDHDFDRWMVRLPHNKHA